MPPGDEQFQQKRRSRVTTGGQNPNPLLVTTSGKQPAQSQTNYHRDEDAFLDDPPRQNTSVVRLATPQNAQMQRITGSPANAVPPRRQQGVTRDVPLRQGQTRITTQPSQSRETREPQKGKKRVHWLLPVGVGMVAMLVLWVIGTALLAWGNQRLDDLHYGNPRTYQTNAFVKDGDSQAHPSHFIAINLNRQAIVIEFIGGDPSKTVTYVAPFYIGGDGGDLAPVTVDFRDVTGHHDGKLDMIINIRLPQNQVFVFVNEGTKFRPPTSTDKIHLS